MRKLLSILLILLLPVQGMLGSAMAMQMDLSTSPASVSVPMDCDMASSPVDAPDGGLASGGCPHCTDCPMCHLLAVTVRWVESAPAHAWAIPLFTPQTLRGIEPSQSFKPPKSWI
ncbi:MAG: hypothetical protein RLZZ126_1618 [Pseudomonadota bacterium]|jgi:hypothetical protein